MVDLRDLQRRGIMPRQIPRDQSEIQTDQDGFIKLGNGNVLDSVNNSISSLSSPHSSSSSSPKNTSNASFFGFMDNTSSSSLSPSTTPSEDLRKISSQLSNLDNQIYKLEQRIELLERKLGVEDSSTTSNTGVMGW